jgi:hypothetical protein
VTGPSPDGVAVGLGSSLGVSDGPAVGLPAVLPVGVPVGLGVGVGVGAPVLGVLLGLSVGLAVGLAEGVGDALCPVVAGCRVCWCDPEPPDSWSVVATVVLPDAPFSELPVTSSKPVTARAATTNRVAAPASTRNAGTRGWLRRLRPPPTRPSAEDIRSRVCRREVV